MLSRGGENSQASSQSSFKSWQLDLLDFSSSCHLFEAFSPSLILEKHAKIMKNLETYRNVS